MKKASIQLIENYYTYKGADSRDLEILAIFLTDDVEAGSRSSVEFYREWISKPELHKTAGTATTLVKDGENVVLTDFIDSMKDKDDFGGWKEVFIGGACQMTAKELDCILKEWESLANGVYEEIVVIKDESGFKVQGKN